MGRAQGREMWHGLVWSFKDIFPSKIQQHLVKSCCDMFLNGILALPVLRSEHRDVLPLQKLPEGGSSPHT